MNPEDFLSETSRFWSYVDRTGDCWLWTGERNKYGYGIFCFWQDGKRHRFYAHRLSLALAGFPVLDRRVVRHNCDTPACVRADHLTEGSQRDNVRDAVARGRHNATGLCVSISIACRKCGVWFTGFPNRRYCDDHRPKPERRGPRRRT